MNLQLVVLFLKKIPGTFSSPGIQLSNFKNYLNDIPRPVETTLYCALV